MKKYVVVSLLFLPLVAFGAPSVRKLGTAGSVVGTAAVGKTAKAVPARTGSVSKISGGKVASVGSLRAKSATTGVTGAITGSTARLTGLKSLWANSTPKVVNTGGAYIGSASAARVECDGEDICTKLGDLQHQLDEHRTDINNNTNKITINEGNIQNLSVSPKFNSVRIGTSDKPGDFTDDLENIDGPGKSRAWIWVEEDSLSL